MRRILYFMALFNVLFFSKWSEVHSQDFGKIRDHVVEDFAVQKERAVTPGAISNLINSMTQDGKWSNIKYDDSDKPRRHLQNLEIMSLAYVDKNNSYYGSAELLSSIEKGISYWLDHRPIAKNWWFNDIGYPKHLGMVLVVMATSKVKNIEADLVNRSLELMKATRPASSESGANKADIATHNFYAAIVSENSKALKRAASDMYSDVRTFAPTQEGIQKDFSFFQHESQLYISGYGREFVSRVYPFAYFLKDTDYAMPQEKIDILNEFFFNTYIAAIRGSYIDFNTEGRGIARNNILYKDGIARADENDLLSKVLAVSGSEYAEEISNIRKRLLGTKSPSYKVQPMHKHFWIGDYTIHKMPNYSFNVRMVSERTRRTERGNNENKLGRTLPDGSTNIQVAGDEYSNIMPVWDWNKIPGTTSKDYKEDVEIKGDWGIHRGKTNFVGGVSDGITGVSVYTQDYDGVKAKKGYFFFEKAVVCLGSDITSDGTDDVVTTMNQTLSNGDVYVSGSVLSGESFSGDANYVWHNRVAYFFPNGTKLHITNKDQSGNWNRISTKDGAVTKKVFSLYMNHTEENTDKYQYIVMPAVDHTQSSPPANIHILYNTPSIQAVEDTDKNILQVIFYEAGQKIEWDNKEFSTDKPCLLLLRKEYGVTSVFVSEPTQTFSEIKLSYGPIGGELSEQKLILDSRSLDLNKVKGSTKEAELGVTDEQDERPKVGIKISNAFSPNNDGVNDTWVITNINHYPKTRIEIFDREGRSVYFQRRYQNNWRGYDNNGYKLPQGSYRYSVDVSGDGTEVYKGWLFINY